jgi:hypothetical protein
MPPRLPFVLVTVLGLSATRLAVASDGGVPDAQTGPAVDASGGEPTLDASRGTSADAAESEIPLGCDGALCDTSNDSTCSVVPGGVGSSGAGAGAIALVLPGVLFALGRRVRRGTERPGRGGRTC